MSSPNQHDGPVTRAPLQLNLTAAGWAVVAMIIAAIFMSARNRLAVGFLMPLLALLLVDMFLSRHVILNRQVSIRASRTTTYLPAGIPLRVQATGRPTPLLIKLVFGGGIEEAESLVDEPITVELQAKHSGVVNYVRCNVSCSVFGLSFAQRWEVHRLPTLHWSPAPRPVQLSTPEAIDQVARLREYIPGDRMSRVSWPVTARTGRMHVRSAGGGQEEFHVVINLGIVDGDPGEGAVVSAQGAAMQLATALESESQTVNVNKLGPAVIEGTLQLATTLISQLIEDGHQVRLLTTELAPQVLDALRDSAIETPRLPEQLPAETLRNLVTEDAFVLDDEELARRIAFAEVGPSVAPPYRPYVEVSMLGVRTVT